MRSICRLSFCAIILILQGRISYAQPQPEMSIRSAKPVICYHSNKNNPDHIPAPENFKRWRQGASARIKTSNFEVEYINFPQDGQAKIAFQYAVDIWATQLASPVTIKIRAQWQRLDAGVLGNAIWGSKYANFDGAQHLNTFYPVALAEKMAGKELNDAADPEIVASFSSATSWYFGTDGNTPAGKMDFVTIVLHEIAHGLGFTDTYDVESTLGSVANGVPAFPMVYDLFVENATGQKLFTQFVSPSAALKTQLTSNNIFFNSPLAAAASAGARPRLFAPSPFDGGSSIAHLNENTYNIPGNPNKLMTPQIDFAESIHDPGSILLNIFKDMGWVFTRIQHERLKDTERRDGAPYVVKVKIVSDNGYLHDQVKLNYTTDNLTFTQVSMTPTGVADEFQASLPGVTTDRTYKYFISVPDVLNRTFTNPGKVQIQKQQPVQDLIIFNIGTDNDAPEIAHTPVVFIFKDQAELALTAEVTDNLGVRNVTLEYAINGGSLQTLEMQQTSDAGDQYQTIITLPSGLVIGNTIKYRILASDNSAGANVAQAPENEFYSIFVTGIMDVRDLYINDFNQPTIDFIGNSLSITTPSGFHNGAIHSDHPYKDGTDAKGQSNYTFQLQVPIRLNKGNPFIQFDEIVLVEPGESGSVFGDPNFFDYVIVEGSKDGGATWKPFADGYDSRHDAAWLTRYNLNISNKDSQSKGTPQLFRKRTINMLEKNNFVAGDEVLVRFRLFADKNAHGWGWAIDNLSVQGPVTDIEVLRATGFSVYPNPTAKDLTVVLFQPQENAARICIINTQGQVVFDDEVLAGPDAPKHQIDVSAYPAGLYLIKIDCAEETVTKRLIKVNE